MHAKLLISTRHAFTTRQAADQARLEAARAKPWQHDLKGAWRSAFMMQRFHTKPMFRPALVE